MRKLILIGYALVFEGLCSWGQEGTYAFRSLSGRSFAATYSFTDKEPYEIHWAVDAPIISVGMAWSGYAFTKIYSKEDIPEDHVLALSPGDVNVFDRALAGVSNPEIDHASDYLFYGSMPLPVFLFFDREIRRDALKIGLLYLESFAVTGLLYTGSVYFVDRYRPETYNTDIALSERVNGNNQNSFFAGHVAVVATSTFFMAKVFHDYHPEAPGRWILWGGAAVATGTMIYMRAAAGKHFPSDLLLGAAVGTLSGILVPHLHKKEAVADQIFRIRPFWHPEFGSGLSFSYSF